MLLWEGVNIALLQLDVVFMRVPHRLQVVVVGLPCQTTPQAVPTRAWCASRAFDCHLWHSTSQIEAEVN